MPFSMTKLFILTTLQSAHANDTLTKIETQIGNLEVADGEHWLVFFFLFFFCFTPYLCVYMMLIL